MKERVINEILATVKSLSPEQMFELRDTLSCVLSKYTVTEEERHLVVYQGYLPECFEAYFAIKSIEGLSINTLKLYKFHLEHFFRAVDKPLDKIRANDVRMFLALYERKGTVSKRTLDNIRTCISAFFHWASAEGYIPSNPCMAVAPIKYERIPRKPLSNMELEKLRQVSSKDVRDNLIVEFFYSTGCRVSEFVGVKVSDIDMVNHQCIVLGKGNKHRPVYLNAKSQLAIEKYLWATNRTLNSDSYLIQPMRTSKKRKESPNIPVDVSSIQVRVGALGEMAGLTRHIHPHLIRHTFATDGLSRGLAVEQVQKLLGHSSIATTMIYAHVDESRLQAEHTRCIV